MGCFSDAAYAGRVGSSAQQRRIVKDVIHILKRLVALPLVAGALILAFVATPVRADGLTGQRAPAAPSDAALSPFLLGGEIPASWLKWKDNSTNETRFEVKWAVTGALGGTTYHTEDWPADHTWAYSYYLFEDLRYASVRACNGAGCSAWATAQGGAIGR
jgi:hypothetical protein